MSKPNDFTVVLDVDDVLYDCNQDAAQQAGIPFDLIRGHIDENSPAAPVLRYYNDPVFVLNQKPFPGAIEFLQEICGKYSVYLATAVPPAVAEARKLALQRDIPFIHPDDVIYARNKSLIAADVFVDDNPNHVKASMAGHAVLFRQPWNEQEVGIPSVSSYEELKVLIDRAAGMKHKYYREQKRPVVLCLIGPAGSDKGRIRKRLIEDPFFESPVTYTTRRDAGSGYQQISRSAFLDMEHAGSFAEHAAYASDGTSGKEDLYGVKADDIDEILERGHNAVVIVESSGAMQLDARYGDSYGVLTVFLQRDLDVLFAEMYDRAISEKKSRKFSERSALLIKEYAKKNLWDEMISYRTVQSAVTQIRGLF